MIGEMTVVTYGGGEILFKLFTGIKMIFDSGFIKWISYLMAAISTVYVIFLTYFKPHPDHITKNFLFPVLVLVSLCFTFKTTVKIEDTLPLSQGGINLLSRDTNQNAGNSVSVSYSVDDVPLVVGFLSKTISTIGHKMTEAIESVFHAVDDEKYTKTGMIFGAETALDMGEIVINDGNLDNNLRTFCKNCMLYDLALNLYTVKDLKNETDLLGFLKDRTAKSRFMNYTEDSSPKPDLISCKEAIEKIAKKFKSGGSEIVHQQKKQVFQRLPVAYQALTKYSGDKEEMIKQLLMMSVISEEMSSEAFATKRAALQQKTTWKTMGGIADGLVVTTRCVIEALVYASIIFVVPMLFLPSGFSYLKNWLWLLIWIQLWPPFYAILDYISLIAARGQADGLFDPEKAKTCCLTIYNTVGLSSVYGDISAYAKSMKVLIPPLTYAILQGGVGSFVHLTSSMMGASQQATSQAASDQVSGNYSFGNTSMDTSNFANATYGQQNYASSLRSGYISSETARAKVDYSSDSSTINEKISTLSHGLSFDESVRSSLAKSVTESQTAHESSTRSLNESISNAGRDARDWTHHLAHDSSYSISDSSGKSVDVSKAAQFMENTVQSFAKDHRIGVDAAWEIFGSTGAGIPGTEIRGGVSGKLGAHASETFSDALSVSESAEFREAFNTVENYAKNFSHNSTDGEGERLATSFTQSVDQMKSDSTQFSTTLDKLNQASNVSSLYNDSSLSERQDLTQKYIDWGIKERGLSINDFPTVIEENPGLIQDFISDFTPEMQNLKEYTEPEKFHENSLKTIDATSTVSQTISSERFDELNVGGTVQSDVAEKLSVKPINDTIFKETKEKIDNTKREVKPKKMIGAFHGIAVYADKWDFE